MNRAVWLILVVVACQAEERCEWLNRATAAGVLGGAVTATITKSSCEYVRGTGSESSSLWIEVTRDYAAVRERCGAKGSPLKALGNEALACACERDREIGEQVVGRVRNQAFVVRLSTTNRSADRGSLREKVRKIAEQVAGSLF